MMILLTLGYVLMGLIFLIVRLVYHILTKSRSQDNPVRAIRGDCISLCDYAKQLVVSNPKKAKIIAVIMVCLIILLMMPLQIEMEYVTAECLLSTIMFTMFLTAFTPKEDSSNTGFPVEIFGFVYSVIFMFYSASYLVIDVFYANEALRDDMWIYGYIVTLISYAICITFLSQFIKRDISKQEIILLGMVIMTTLEFIVYYGVGFFGGIKWFTYEILTYDTYEFNLTEIFGDITSIINQGIVLSSQSQLDDISLSDIWGYIILNGTDMLTVTVVVGYLVQKFMEQ